MSKPLPAALRISRRTAFQYGAATLVSLTCHERLLAQQVSPATDILPPLNRFPRMMQEYLGARVTAAHEIGQARRAAVKTRADAEAYVINVRGLIRDCFGPFPERTPLNPRITGIVDRKTYQIEKVIFESRPGFLVTGNLYVPKNCKGRLPGVVGSCGHSANGKAAEAYQAFAQCLTRLGYVVLIFDPIGQGERLQYPDVALKSRVGAGVHEHLLAGNQQYLVGEFFGTWRVWDGIRALDYLLTRPEVDPQRVGITGNSGGGTETTWLCGLEPRWSMAAPSCFVTSFRRNFENELPADTEQCPPRALLHGLDHSDFLAAMAPRPVIILAAEKDYFDVRGALEAYDRLRPLYTLLGAEANLRLRIGPDGHGFSPTLRQAMYEFFNAQTGLANANVEQEFVVEKDETLQCTPLGQVAAMSSKTVSSLTAARSQELRQIRGNLDTASVHERVQAMIPKRPDHPPEFKILRPVKNRRYVRPHATWYVLESEPQVSAIVCRLEEHPHFSRPPQGAGKVLLYVSHQSSDLELRNELWLKQLIEAQPRLEIYALDPRGIGDSQPQTCGENQFLVPYGSDYFYAAHSIMLGQPIPIQRAFDVLRTIDWIRSWGRTEIHLVAAGWGTIPATLAAIVSDHVHQVTLHGALTSFSEIAESEDYEWPLSIMIPDVLRSFDLTDCYRALASKELRQIDANGAGPRAGRGS